MHALESARSQRFTLSSIAALVAVFAALGFWDLWLAASQRAYVRAVDRRDMAAMRALLDRPVKRCGPTANGNLALVRAAASGDLELSTRLIRCGCPVGAVDVNDNFPLLAATRVGNVALISRLITAGANANQMSPSGLTALKMAAARGQAECARALLAAGADVNARDARHGVTALDLAAVANRPELARLLLSHGADPNNRNRQGFTLLKWMTVSGSWRGRPRILRMLREAGGHL